jgi:hypothetical protein
MSNKTTVKVDADIKAEYETLFEQVHGVKPVTSSLLDNCMREEIDNLKKELSKKKK